MISPLLYGLGGHEPVHVTDFHAVAHPGHAGARVRHAVDHHQTFEAHAHSAVEAALRAAAASAQRGLAVAISAAATVSPRWAWSGSPSTLIVTGAPRRTPAGSGARFTRPPRSVPTRLRRQDLLLDQDLTDLAQSVWIGDRQPRAADGSAGLADHRHDRLQLALVVAEAPTPAARQPELLEDAVGADRRAPRSRRRRRSSTPPRSADRRRRGSRHRR